MKTKTYNNTTTTTTTLPNANDAIKAKSKRSSVLTFLNYTAALSSIAAGSVILKCIFSNPYYHIPSQFLSFIPTEWNFEQKLTLSIQMSSWIAMVILICVYMVIASRWMTASANPVKHKDHLLVTLMNRILANTIEQAAVFVPLLTAWTVSKADVEERHETVLLTLVFIAGRIAYVIGYSFGQVINVSTLRILGFVLTLGPSALLAQRLLGFKYL